MVLSQGLDASLLGLLGLLIGSFLNVVIYRLARDAGGAVEGRMRRNERQRPARSSSIQPHDAALALPTLRPSAPLVRKHSRDSAT
jgi:hypothetical protein